MATRILMVCLGNICRSPLAEGILKSKVDPNKVFIDSAGTSSYHIGNPPDKRSIKVAAKYGIDISMQRCRQFDIEDFSNFDFIYAMDLNNFKTIIALTSNENSKYKVQLIMGKTNADSIDIPDPYYQGSDGFEHVYKMLDTACDRIARELESRIKF